MKRILFLFLFTNILVFEIHAQNPQFSWSYYGNGRYSYAKPPVMGLDKEGKVVIGRTLEDSVIFKDFPFYPKKRSYTDIYIHKFDSLGIVDWALTLSGVGNDYITDIQTDGKSNIYATGYFSDSFLVNGQFERNDSFRNLQYQMFIIKLSPTGQFKWFKKIDVWHIPNIYKNLPEPKLACDINDNLWVMNRYFEKAIAVDTLNIKNVSICNSLSSVFLLQLNSDGTALRTRSIHGDIPNESNALNYGRAPFPEFDFTINRNNKISMCVSFRSDTIMLNGIKIPDFDSSKTNISGVMARNHLFITQLDSDLQFQHYHLIEGRMKTITSDKWDNIYLGGQIYSVTINGTTFTGNRRLSKDITMVKLNKSCVPIQHFGDSTAYYYFYDNTPVDADNFITQVYVDQNQNILCQLQYVASWLILPNGKLIRSYTSGSHESYLIKLDSNFNILWTKYTSELYTSIEDSENGKAYLTSNIVYVGFDPVFPNDARQKHQPTACISYRGVKSTNTQGPHTSLNDISLFPNPADYELQIELADAQVECLKLYNAQGQLVVSKSIDPNDSDSIVLQTSTFPDGVYFLAFVGSSTYASQRVIIKH